MPRNSNETRIIIYDSRNDKIQIIIDYLRNAYPRGFSNTQIVPTNQGDLHAICSLHLDMEGSPKLVTFMPRSPKK